MKVQKGTELTKNETRFQNSERRYKEDMIA